MDDFFRAASNTAGEWSGNTQWPYELQNNSNKDCEKNMKLNRMGNANIDQLLKIRDACRLRIVVIRIHRWRLVAFKFIYYVIFKEKKA